MCVSIYTFLFNNMLTTILRIDLAGWQLDKIAEAAKNKNSDGESTDDDSDEEDIPFACLICRKQYTDPIVTRCGHYFCSACAIKRFAKTPRCLACGSPTGGMFNRADKVIAKREKKRKEKDDRRAARETERGGADEDSNGGVQIEGLVGTGSGGSDDDSEDED
jgi:RING finger protein 113A